MPNRTDPSKEGRRPDRGLPEAMRDLPWELPHRFLGLDDVAADLGSAAGVVLPVPYEATTSYGGGARLGPRAILEASRFVELYDQELDQEPAARGIHTLPALELTRAGPAEAMDELGRAYARIAEEVGDRFMVMLGGEHSVSFPAILAQADRLADERLTVLQLDAHADLRDEYEGTGSSHASAMARVLERADVVAVGVRGVSSEEVAVAREHEGVTLVWADDMARGDAWIDRAVDALGPRVYVTFDVDYFDPSIVPSTGTPEPGGGAWYPTLRLLRRVFEERFVVAADVVELAPMPGLHAPDFTVAKLVYKLFGYAFTSRR